MPTKTRTPKALLAEARLLWADDPSFDAGVSLLIRETLEGAMFLGWALLTRAEQRNVAERMLDRAISRQRARDRRAA